MKSSSFDKKQYELARKEKQYLVHLTIRDPGKTAPGSCTTINGPMNDKITDMAWDVIREFCKG